MKSITILCCLLFIGCGSPLLESGIYDVEITYTKDYMYASGHQSEAQWDIDEDGGKYKFHFVGADTIFKGKESGSEVVFHYEQDFDREQLGDCVESNIIDIVLDPGKAGK